MHPQSSNALGAPVLQSSGEVVQLRFAMQEDQDMPEEEHLIDPPPFSSNPAGKVRQPKFAVNGGAENPSDYIGKSAPCFLGSCPCTHLWKSSYSNCSTNHCLQCHYTFNHLALQNESGILYYDVNA